MKKITISFVAVLCLILTNAHAQETFETRATSIANKIQKVTDEEKAALTIEVESIAEQLQNGTITKQQSDEKKTAAAEKAAKNIENRTSEAHQELLDLVQQKVDGTITSDPSPKKYGKYLTIEYGENDKNDTIKAIRKTPRTTSQFVFATGLNNLSTNNSVAHSDYKIWGSHFYEWGFTYNTRIVKDKNLLHAKYGLSLMYNNLRPTDNRSFVANGDQTILQTNAINLKDSRLRNVYLVVPAHVEFDFSKNRGKSSDQFVTHNGFRVGLGGYAGANIKSKQVLRFEADGNDFRTREKGAFNVNDFIYGLSAYIGYRGTSLYMKYDLNPLFKNNAVDQNNVSLGIRFDIN